MAGFNLLVFAGWNLSLLLRASCQQSNGTASSSDRQLDFNPSKALLDNCNISPHTASPQVVEGIATPVQVFLEADRFMSIDDVAETFAITGAATTIWQVPCVAKLAESERKGGVWPPQFAVMPRENPEDFWYPVFTHRNAKDDAAMKYAVSLNLGIKVPEGIFRMSYIGKFESYCDYNFYYFPFDRQVGRIALTMVLTTEYVFISAAKLAVTSSKFLPENSMWRLVGQNAIVSNLTIHTVGELVHAQATFYLVFERKPDYYLTNLFGPSFILSLLELSTFFVPGESPDRCTLAATIMLAIFVLQSLIMANVPETPKPILVAYYVIGQMTFAMLCAIYAAAMCGYRSYSPDQAVRKVRIIFLKRHVSFCYLIDCLAFIAATLLFCLLNFGLILFLSLN